MTRSPHLLQHDLNQTPFQLLQKPLHCSLHFRPTPKLTPSPFSKPALESMPCRTQLGYISSWAHVSQSLHLIWPCLNLLLNSSPLTQIFRLRQSVPHILQTGAALGPLHQMFLLPKCSLLRFSLLSVNRSQIERYLHCRLNDTFPEFTDWIIT